MAELTVPVTKQVPVKFLHAEMGVRYWEDAEVNGVGESDDDPKIPLRRGDTWEITIDLETGTIPQWPQGVTAKTHYKVCDAGVYRAMTADNEVILERDGYVPRMLSPGGDGYGDYVIMEIDGEGKIQGFKPDLSFFEDDDY